MGQIFLIGGIAGLAGALLFMAPLTGGLLAFPLIALCTLPIAIAGLGWTAVAGGVSAGVAAIVLTIAVGPESAASYLVNLAVPVVWLTRLLLLSRQSGPEPQDLEWFPLGPALFQGAVITAVGIIMIGLFTGFDTAALTDELTAAMLEMFAQTPQAGPLPTEAELRPVAELAVEIVPGMIGIFFVLMMTLNLWLGSRVAASSGRLPRPRTPLWTVRLPAAAALTFGIAVLVSFAPGALGHAAMAFTGTLGAALALAGLAVIHASTRGNDYRVLILSTVYVVTVIFGFPIVILAGLGLANTFFDFRSGKSGGAANDNQ